MKDLLAKYIAPLFLSAIAVLAPIKAIMVVTGILIFADLITGILAANKRGEKINSAGIRRTISKIFIYQLAIIVGFLIEKYMLSDFLPISKVAAAAIASVEGFSIFENLNTIDGSNLFKKAINLLGSSNDAIKKDVIEAVKGDSKEPPK
jgi:DNA integrity scanning protein DisA with diadenylate cyclase activity